MITRAKLMDFADEWEQTGATNLDTADALVREANRARLTPRDRTHLAGIAWTLSTAATMAIAAGDRYAEVNAKDLRRYSKTLTRIAERGRSAKA